MSQFVFAAAPKVPKKHQTIDGVLEGMQSVSGSLGAFLRDIFEHTTRHHGPANSPKNAAMVSRFLGGSTDVKAEEIVDLMYNHPSSYPKGTRSTSDRPDGEPMARARILEWATNTVEDVVSKEAEIMASKAGGFHLPANQINWEFIHEFSFAKVMAVVQEKSPTLLRVLTAAAIPSKKRDDQSTQSFAEHFAKAIPSGSGNNKRDPYVIIAIACMMLFAARNLHFVAFQQIIGLFLFANTCSYAIYAVLSRAGISTSYTSVGKLLRKLTTSSQNTVRDIAQARAFLLIYDNINRMRRAWDPDLGQKDTVLSGTAATFVELEDCDVEEALDPKPLKESCARGDRAKLDIAALEQQIDFPKLKAVFALHCLKFLADEVPSLADHRKFINERFRTTLQSHRMKPNRKSKIHPLQTSGINEGTMSGQKDVIDDLTLRQLKLTKEEIEKLLLILGGDQSTVEKIRTLKRFLADCEHGHSRYGWVLPLIQLWHMGWADLERILATHWGPESSDAAGDISTFQAVNILLGRKVKNVKWPDYYPAQALIFDNLRIEILDCWRNYLKVEDLNAHFCDNPVDIEDLLKQADTLVRRYLTTEAAERAMFSKNPSGINAFVNGAAWRDPAIVETDTNASPKASYGDQVLGNTLLRMRDSMLHYEFHHAIADGDIGRAMNVMAVWTFTFTGSGKGKYSNELLELACNFKYEYSAELKKLILNNWLVNLTGIEGCWFPMDLMQEHNIKQLKKLSDRRDATFSGDFFKDVVATNIRALLKANDSIRAAVRLGGQGGTHRRKKKIAAEKRLADAMRERELHKFRLGRTHGFQAQDDFAKGHEMLATGSKIKDFIRRTLVDASAIYDEDGQGSDAAQETEVDEAPEHEHDVQNLLMPSIIVDGELVTDEGLNDGWGGNDSDDDD